MQVLQDLLFKVDHRDFKGNERANYEIHPGHLLKTRTIENGNCWCSVFRIDRH